MPRSWCRPTISRRGGGLQRDRPHRGLCAGASFSGSIVSRPWAEKNKDLLRRILAAHRKSVTWFYDPANRAEAVQILAEVSKIKPRTAEKSSYDFLVKASSSSRTA